MVATQTVFSASDRLEKLHTIPEVAAAIGCHPVSAYKAANGQLKLPFPRVIRVGRLRRVRDCDFQEFLNGLSAVKLPAADVPAAAATQKKKPVGRPTKALQIAKRHAASVYQKEGSAA